MKAWSNQFQVLLSAPQPSLEQGWTRRGLSPEILLLLLLSRRRSSPTIQHSKVFLSPHAKGKQTHLPDQGCKLAQCDTGSGDAPSRPTLPTAAARRQKAARTAPGGPGERDGGTPCSAMRRRSPGAQGVFVTVEQLLSLPRGWKPLLR